jgi:predicted flap endonuclease-1-like 5' DNA nuclease
MGLFILGVLAGWLAEWLFFTFVLKGKSKSDSSDCSELLAQLGAKNKEIESLKASLSDNSKTESKTESIASLISTTSTTPAAASSTKAAEKPAEKKVPAKKATAVKSTTTAKKPVAKKVAPKKVEPKKVVAKKAIPVKKPTPSAKKAPLKKTTGDDLTKLSGIGPSMAATMAELGITSYKKLAAMDDDILRDMLEASGARLNNNKEAMDSWNEQATLADKGDFAGLKKLQDELKK